MQGREPDWTAPISEEELTELALAADPDQPLDPEAIPMSVYLGTTAPALPEWYMAPLASRLRGRGRRMVLLGFVSSLLAIEAFGLCSTYGQLPFH